MTSKIVWSIKEITEILRQRQLNRFDCNIGVSGKRGDGKSTLLHKIFKSFRKDGFRPQKHQVYAQKDVIKLLARQKFGFCWDDEAINSGYKRNFQKTGQKNLVQVITNYRDNFNIYGSALPFFYSLDKDLRELIFMHLHIIQRGIAVVLLPIADQIHSQDPWDTANNIKIEQKEYTRMKKNPKARFRYEKLSTFAGYLYFGPMSKKQEEIYFKIKQKKRAKSFKEAGIIEEDSSDYQSVKERLYKLLLEGKLTKNGLIQTALATGTKFSTLCSAMNTMLKDHGEVKTLTQFLVEDNIITTKSKDKSRVNSLVPPIPGEVS